MKKKTILIIEDNLDSMELLEAILEGKYAVIKTSDSTKSVEMAKENEPSLVLLDISMPKMDGNEILRRFKQDKSLRRMPIIAVTAHAMKGDRERYLRIGFDGYVSKPIIDESLLLNSIEKLIHKRSVEL
ncbi:MAG: response regulator [Candidatus Magnetoovum sp. WYHC-5]|nr:response regulator [Candidatus Magnetoovum sp. WYHC-5]